VSDEFTYPDDVHFGIDGGYYRIYDGVIIWVLNDGRSINRFRGEGSSRERRIDELIDSLAAEPSLTTGAPS
jgi:hypothetical protein